MFFASVAINKFLLWYNYKCIFNSHLVKPLVSQIGQHFCRGILKNASSSRPFENNLFSQMLWYSDIFSHHCNPFSLWYKYMCFFNLHLCKNLFLQLLQWTHFCNGKNICASSSCSCGKIHFHNCCNQRLFAMVQIYVLLQFACVQKFVFTIVAIKTFSLW